MSVVDLYPTFNLDFLFEHIKHIMFNLQILKASKLGETDNNIISPLDGTISPDKRSY